MKLMDARRALRFSIDELAEKSGVSRGTITNIEKGISQPKRMETVRKLEKALGVNGQMIEEFWPVLGEPDEFHKRFTPAMLAADLAELSAVDDEDTLSSAEFWQQFTREPS